MQYIGYIIPICRFVEHGVFISLIFIFSSNVYNLDDIATSVLIIYVLIAYMAVFSMYIFFVCSNVIVNKPVSTNRTLDSMVELEMWEQIEQMIAFGFNFSERKWDAVVGKNYPIRKEGNDFHDNLLTLCAVEDLPIMMKAAIAKNKDINCLSKPLCYAAKYGNEECIEILISAGADVNATIGKECNSKTALFFAVDANSRSVECIGRLVKAGANIDQTDNSEKTALYFAIEQEKSASVGKLMQLGASLHKCVYQWVKSGDIDTITKQITKSNVNIKDDQGQTALFYAAIENRPDIIDVLISKGGVVNDTDKNEQTVLSYAAQHFDCKCLKKLIANGGKFKSDIQDHKNVTKMLHETVTSDSNVDILEMLIDAGVDINGVDNNERTALMFAARAGNARAVKTLIEHKANVTHTDNHGRNALFYAIENDTPELIDILIGNGIDVNQTNNQGNTALTYACKQEYTTSIDKIASKLIAHNANVNLQNINGWTALMHAIKNRYYKTADILLKSDADVNLKGRNGATAVILTMQNEEYDFVATLVANGANVNETDDQWLSLLMYAIGAGKIECVNALIRRGLNINAQDKQKNNGLIYTRCLFCFFVVFFFFHFVVTFLCFVLYLLPINY